MSALRQAAQQALEALEFMEAYLATEQQAKSKAITALRAALAEPVQEPVAGRAFLERILAAMEGVIDVADRKTDEFDDLRSCVIDLTLMLHTAPPQRTAEPVQEPVAQQALNALVMMRDKYGEYACPACDHADAAIKALRDQT